jgi:hypothetical protein
MILKFEDPEISGDGFSNSDTFGRKETAQSILSLYRLTGGDFTVLLDAPWGHGKTFFLKQFTRMAETNGWGIISFDAFAHELTGDAFGSLTGRFLSKLEADKPNSKKLKEKLLHAAAAVSKSAVQASAKLAVTYATAGVLSGKSFDALFENEEQEKAVADAMSEQVDRATVQALSSMLNSHAEREAGIKALNVSLSAVVEEIQRNSEQKRVIFIVDELDRCRPDFALDVLEVIKHLIANERIVFLLSADVNQLNSSIQKRYGLGENGEAYLQKFYDVRVKFPAATPNTKSIYQGYAKYLAPQLPIDQESQKHAELTFECFEKIATSRNISIREFQKLCQLFAIVLYQTQEHNYRPPPLIAALCAAKTLNADLYGRLQVGHCSAEELIEFFGMTYSTENERRTDWMVNCWKFFLMTDAQLARAPDNVKSWGESMTRYNFFERQKVIPTLAARFIETIQIED